MRKKIGMPLLEVARRRKRVAEMHRTGIRSSTELARVIFETDNPTKAQVYMMIHDKRVIMRAWVKQTEKDGAVVFAQEVKVLEQAMARAWRDYEESGRDRQVRMTVTKRRPILDHAFQPVMINGDPSYEETTTITERAEGRSPGDPKFFALFLKAHEQLCKLRGVNMEATPAAVVSAMTYDEAVTVLKRLGLEMGPRPVDVIGPVEVVPDQRVTVLPAPAAAGPDHGTAPPY